MNRKYFLKKNFNVARASRLLAKLVDLFIVFILAVFFYPLGIFLAAAYIGISDSLQNGQSIGKKFIGFSVISLEDGSPCSIKQSCIRNLPIMIPLVLAIIPIWGWILAGVLGIPLILIELYLIYKLDSAHRWGDVMADTSVIAASKDQNLATNLSKDKQKGWFGESPAN